MKKVNKYDYILYKSDEEFDCESNEYKKQVVKFQGKKDEKMLYNEIKNDTKKIKKGKFNKRPIILRIANFKLSYFNKNF